MSLQLRPYQAGILDALRQGFADGKRSQILYAPTGAGKTEMAIALLDAAKKKGSKAAKPAKPVKPAKPAKAVGKRAKNAKAAPKPKAAAAKPAGKAKGKKKGQRA